MDIEYELFMSFWGVVTPDEASQMMSLIDIKEWWKQNIGTPPEDLTKKLGEIGYHTVKVEDSLFWCFKTK